MKFVAFHLMPYAHPKIAETIWAMAEPKTAWVLLSNRHFNPSFGADLYARFLDELEYAEEAGFDIVAVNEHHQTAYGTMPSPNVMAAALTQRVKRAQIAVLGNAIPLRSSPQRVAEEIAMLDLLSGGRVISGFVRGIGFEYTSFQMPPSDSRERFEEAHDLIVRAWTEDGPFAWHGKYYHFDYVNPWPRPLQEPHPPIWIPSQGSGETVRYAAERRYTYLQTFTALDRVATITQEYRDVAQAEYGYKATPEQLGWAFCLYMAETDEEAVAGARRHIDVLFNRFLVGPMELFFPPGYLSEQSHGPVWDSRTAIYTTYDQTLESLCDKRIAIVGSPETVVKQLKEVIERTGVGILVPLIQLATMEHHETMRNIRLFGEHVIPELKDYAPNLVSQPQS
jgi:alkanesulfonate monooxygenase SsuD/methylene tetrahydromethanopterin reductase-like flavin-dependent oxidoreductase (luciferase family)